MSSTRIDLKGVHKDEGGVTIANVSEADALCASPIACAVADAWGRWTFERNNIPDVPAVFADALDAIELATRPSPLRKVKP